MDQQQILGPWLKQKKTLTMQVMTPCLEAGSRESMKPQTSIFFPASPETRPTFSATATAIAGTREPHTAARPGQHITVLRNASALCAPPTISVGRLPLSQTFCLLQESLVRGSLSHVR